MHWTDEAIILSVKPHGETAAVAEVFTRAHGRHLGLVHGGRSRKMRPVLQIGNHVDCTWKARLSEHLGHVTMELRRGYAAAAMDDSAALAGLTSLCTLARLLPERDPHPACSRSRCSSSASSTMLAVWPALLVRWELALLGRVGLRPRSHGVRCDGVQRPAHLCLAEVGSRRLGLSRRALSGTSCCACPRFSPGRARPA